MRQRNLDDSENFVRVCSRQKQIRGQDGSLQGVTWDAFALRTEKSESYISGACAEMYDGTLRQQAQKAANNILDNFTQPNKKSYAVLVLKTFEIIAAGNLRNRSLRVRLEPKPSNNAYATIRKLPLDNSDVELLKLLAIPRTGFLALFSEL